MILTIPGPIPSKKNSRVLTVVNGKRRTFPNAAYKKWHRRAKEAVYGQRLVNPSFIEIEFYWPDRRRRDMTNAAESIMDLMVDCGVFQDDSWEHVPRLLLTSAGIDKENPRAEISIIEKNRERK